jgi:hypothetical protein
MRNSRGVGSVVPVEAALHKKPPCLIRQPARWRIGKDVADWLRRKTA